MKPNNGRAAVLAAMTTFLVLPLFSGWVLAPTVPYTLFGTTSGWGFTTGSEANPGPTMFANQSDTVDLTLTKEDGATHRWFLDYNGDSSDAGEPNSTDITVNTPFSFLADTPGIFTYRCAIHTGAMTGTFQINATAPTATITLPSGGLTWTGGSTHSVVWTMTDPQTPVSELVAFLNYSYAGGTQTGTIAGPILGSANPHSQPWVLPLVNATDMTVNLTVIDGDGNKGFDEAFVPNVDSARPRVTAVNPLNGSSSVPTGTWVNLTFNKTMNQTATEPAVSLLAFPTWSPVATVVQGWVGNILTIAPTSPLAPTTTYFVNASSVGKDGSDPGNPLVAFFSNFTTGTPVNTLPSIALSVPSGGERWTGGSTHDIVWSASDPETPPASLTIGLNYSLTGAPPWTLIAGGLSGPSGVTPWNLPSSGSVTAVVRADVSDSDSGTNVTLSPTLEIDATPPTISSRTPDSGDTGVPLNSNIIVSFQEAMNLSTASWFGLQSTADLSWVAGTTSWSSGNQTITLDPSALMASSTTYKVFVNASAQDASNPGNPYGVNTNWTFTTGATIDLTPPGFANVQALPNPANLGGEVNITAEVAESNGIASVLLFVQKGSMEFFNGSMNRGAGSLWFRQQAYPEVGTYDFTLTAKDPSNNENSTSGSFSVSQPLSITDVTAIPAVGEVPVLVNLSANVTATIGVAEVWFDIGGLSNASGTFDPFTGRFVRPLTVGSPGTYLFTVAAKDTAGDWVTAPGSFETVDTTPPMVSAARAIPNLPLGNVTATYWVNASDNGGIASVWINVEGIGNFTLVKNGSVYSASLALPGGTHQVTTGVQDLAGHVTTNESILVVLPAGAGILVLYGTAQDGWGLDPSDLSNPALEFSPRDTVALTLVGIDGTPHFFFLDLNGNRQYDAGEPVSKVFQANFTTVSFPAPSAGEYTYYCGNHPLTMSGTFRVKAEALPAHPPPWTLIGLAILTAAILGIVGVVHWKRRSKKPPVPLNPGR